MAEFPRYNAKLASTLDGGRLLLRPLHILPRVNNREDIDASGLREVENAVGSLQDFSHIPVRRFGCPKSYLGKLGERVNAAEDALDHTVGIER
ncbi:hypothetical protein BH09GEM1_BH09GEM1_39290 [soil metagenome]